MMKKVLATMALGLLATLPATAQTTSPSQSKVLYSFGNYNDFELLKYFKELHENGKRFPTVEEFKTKFGVEPEFVRSHMRKRAVLTGTDNNTRLFPNLREGRTVFLNLPTGTERETGGYPSAQFDNDPFTVWHYTDLFGAWNHGFFQAPGSWIDAAHKHGVDMMSGIKFFDTTGNPGGVSSSSYESAILLQKNGEYIYIKPLIHLLMWLGQDGINYNWESSGYTGDGVVNFHKGLRQYAKELGFDNYRQAIYTSRSTLDVGYSRAWLWDNARQQNIGDIMLNYSGGDFNVSGSQSSADLALSQTGSYDHLYQGAWIVTMNRDFQGMENKPTNICLWGEHANSRFVSNNTGNTDTEKMANLQELYERAFAGGNRNAAYLQSWTTSDWGDRLSTFGGISRMIPERTTLKQNLPFRTFFNTGAGERYYYKGKSASMGGWYNLASQDLQPTFRWVQYERGTRTPSLPVQVAYTYVDAYTGGSSLLFKGNGNADIILYRGLLTVGNAWPKATLAFKAGEAGKRSNGLSLILHKRGAGETDYLVYPFADLKADSWEEQTVELAGLKQGDVIDYIGIRMDDKADQNIYLGELYLHDDTIDASAPSQPKNLRAEVKMETKNSLSVMLAWGVDAKAGVTPTRANQGLVYNDEAGVHHFEILYKEGEEGEVRELGRTTSWATYVPTVTFEDVNEDSEDAPIFGVRAVGNDLKTYSEVTWIKVDRQDSYLLTEPDRYCESSLNPNADGAAVARQRRFLDKVSTSGAKVDLDYTSNTPDADGDNYVYYKDGNLTVLQDQEIDFFFRAYGREVAPGTATRDGMQWCWAATYIDWNNDGVFDASAGSDEKIEALTLGTARKATPEFQTTGVTKKFRIPADATPGKVRVRVIFTDAWFPEPTPCTKTAKGFTFDFDMTIEGTNTGREIVDTRDEGEPDEPENITATAPTSIVAPSTSNYSSVYPNPVASVLHFNNADKAWIFSLDGVLVRSVADASASIDVSGLEAGTYIVKTERAGVTRSHKVVKQ